MNSLKLILACGLSFAVSMTQAQEKLSKWIDKVYTAESPAPTIIVAHGCGGLGKHEHDWAQQIQSWGFNAIVLDSFKPRGFYSGMCNQSSVAPGERVHDVYEITEVISKQPFHTGKFGLVGFSHGGSLALHLANDEANKAVAATVAYYPWCAKWAKSKKGLFGERRSFDDPKIPTAMMLGEKDNWTPIKFCLESVKGNNYQVHIYSQATHAFDMNLPKRQAFGWTLWYEQEADLDSRQKTKELFDMHLR
jgi:dienelactone hydrolase